MFRAISQVDSASLKRLPYVFIKGNRKAAALLVLDLFFGRLPVLRYYTVQQMSGFLAQFREYARLLHFIISHPDPLSISSIRRLFCIREVSSTEYRLDNGSFLHNSAAGARDGSMHRQSSVVVSFSKNGMISVLRKYLGERLRERITKENDSCCKALVFSQCLTFIVNDGRCNRPSCPQEHVKLADLNSERYKLRLAIHLQQIIILQMMYSVNPLLRRRSVYAITCPYCIGVLLNIS